MARQYRVLSGAQAPVWIRCIGCLILILSFPAMAMAPYVTQQTPSPWTALPCFTAAVVAGLALHRLCLHRS